MKALILIAEGFEDSEFFYPYYRLKEEGIDVRVAGPSQHPVTGKHGYSFHVDTTFDQLNADEFDLLVLPGGKGPETVRLSPHAVELTRKMLNDGKPVASICHGIQVLISAKVLAGKKATCWKGVCDDLKAAGAEYDDQPVIVDGNLVTSRCPDDLPAFSAELFKILKRQMQPA